MPTIILSLTHGFGSAGRREDPKRAAIILRMPAELSSTFRLTATSGNPYGLWPSRMGSKITLGRGSWRVGSGADGSPLRSHPFSVSLGVTDTPRPQATAEPWDEPRFHRMGGRSGV